MDRNNDSPVYKSDWPRDEFKSREPGKALALWCGVPARRHTAMFCPYSFKLFGFSLKKINPKPITQAWIGTHGIQLWSQFKSIEGAKQPVCVISCVLDLGSERFSKIPSIDLDSWKHCWQDLDAICICMVDRIGGFISEHGEVVVIRQGFFNLWIQLLKSSFNNCSEEERSIRLKILSP